MRRFATSQGTIREALALADSALSEARRPHEAASDVAERRVTETSAAVIARQSDYNQATADHEALKGAKAGVSARSSAANALRESLSVAARTKGSAQRALDEATREAGSAAAELRRVQAPFQKLIDLCKSLRTALDQLAQEDAAVSRKIKQYEDAERQAAETWEKERNACRSCNGRQGGCSACDPCR